MRRCFVAVAGILALFPLLVSAASGDIPAGFAPTSVFASKTNIASGDSVSIFTVIYNSSADNLTGDVVFTVDGTAIGTKHFSLQSGETQTPSVNWSAVKGAHTASARIENVVGSSDAQISLLNDKADTITLTVAAPPPSSPTTAAVQNVTNIVQNTAQSAAPAAQSVFNSLENLRQNAVHTLTAQLASAPASTAKPKGQVLGAQTYNAPSDSVSTTTKPGIFGAAWRFILQILLYVCQIQWLFYLVLLIVIYILYKLVRTIFAERH